MTFAEMYVKCSVILTVETPALVIFQWWYFHRLQTNDGPGFALKIESHCKLISQVI